MLKVVVLMAALVSPAAAADTCAFEAGGRFLYFVHGGAVAVVVDRDYRDLPYVCTTSSLGTGADGRALQCSDGFSGTMQPVTATSIQFREADWVSTCPDNDPIDIGFGN